MHHHSIIAKDVKWQTNLIECYNEHRHVPFEWGVNDCIIFAARCVDAQIGRDIYAELLIGKYNDEKTAKAFVEKEHGSIENAITAYFNEVPIQERQRGDICLFDGAYENTTGIVWSTGVFAMGLKGSVLLSFNNITLKKVWRV